MDTNGSGNKLQEHPSFFNKLVELPIVKKTLNGVSNQYKHVREKNVFTKCGFYAAEAGAKMALSTTAFAFKALPTTVKTMVEAKVQSANNLACSGLDAVQKKFPIVTEETNEVMEAGINALEESQLVETILTMTESALDCVPANFSRPFCLEPVKKLERIKIIPIRTKKAVNFIVAKGGKKVFWTFVALPLHLTHLGIAGVRYCFVSSLSPVFTVLSYVSVVQSLMPIQVKLRRSKRKTVKVNYKRLLNKSPCPFPASPDKKRKRESISCSEDEEMTVLAFFDEDNNYRSEDDPDYVPSEDEEISDTSSTSNEDSGEASDKDEVDEDENSGTRAQSISSNKEAFDENKNVDETWNVVDVNEKENESKNGEEVSNEAGTSKNEDEDVIKKSKSVEKWEEADEKKTNSNENTVSRSSSHKTEKHVTIKSPSTKPSKPAVVNNKTTTSKVNSSDSENKENCAMGNVS